MSTAAESGGTGRATEGRLREMYWAEGRSQDEIASELGVTQGRISQRMSELGIPTRGAGLTDEQILEEIRRVARLIGRPPTVSDWEEHGRHSYETVRKRFGAYGKGRRVALYG